MDRKIRNEGTSKFRGPMWRCYAIKLGPLALTRRHMTVELIPEIPIGLCNIFYAIVFYKKLLFKSIHPYRTKNVREYFLLDHFYKEYYPLVDRFYSFLQLIRLNFLVYELHGDSRHDEGVHDIMDSSLQLKTY